MLDNGGLLLVGADQLTKCHVALAANNRVHAECGIDPGFRRQARVIAADDDSDVRFERSDERNQPARRAALKRHDRQPDEIWSGPVHQHLDGPAHRRLRQHEVGDGDLMVRVEVAGERRQRSIRHSDGHHGRVLERVGHRQQQNSHPAADHSTAAVQLPIPA